MIEFVEIKEDGYYVDGVLTDESNPELVQWLDEGMPIHEEPVVKEHVLTYQEEVIRDANAALFRRGQLANLQIKANAKGMGAQVAGILTYAMPALEAWKNDGDIMALNVMFSSYTDPVIRGTLDYPYVDGDINTTVQGIIVATLAIQMEG